MSLLLSEDEIFFQALTELYHDFIMIPLNLIR
jgi:hypothetical protein